MPTIFKPLPLTLQGRSNVLPTHGCCFAVFLLTYSARLKDRYTVQEWVDAAKDKPAFLASALNVEGTAQSLLALDLIRFDRRVGISEPLVHLSDTADFPTLSGIARVLLTRAPPVWLRAAVDGERVAYEYIPESDLASLKWLGEELDSVLIDAYRHSVARCEDDVRKWLGDAAELVVVAALELAGLKPIHVSRISDVYGYDIELRLPNRTERLEVKGAVGRTRDTIHISRNEYDKSRLFGPQWRLVQVVFSTSVLVNAAIDSSHVVEIRELPGHVLHSLAPSDSSGFRWTESAKFFPTTNRWRASGLSVDPAFCFEGRSRLPSGSELE